MIDELIKEQIKKQGITLDTAMDGLVQIISEQVNHIKSEFLLMFVDNENTFRICIASPCDCGVNGYEVKGDIDLISIFPTKVVSMLRVASIANGEFSPKKIAASIRLGLLELWKEKYGIHEVDVCFFAPKATLGSGRIYVNEHFLMAEKIGKVLETMDFKEMIMANEKIRAVFS